MPQLFDMFNDYDISECDTSMYMCYIRPISKPMFRNIHIIQTHTKKHPNLDFKG